MKTAEGTPLAGRSYAVLALGESNHAKFCRLGADVEECLARLGAARMPERVECDGDTDAPFKAFRERFTQTVSKPRPLLAGFRYVGGVARVHRPHIHAEQFVHLTLITIAEVQVHGAVGIGGV